MAFHGKVALVTGAGSGMGQLAARRLGAAGASVAALDVDDAGLDATAYRAPQIRVWHCDVTDADAVASVVKEVEAELGPTDRVMNAAGVCLPGRLLDQPVEQIEHSMTVNYLGTVRVVKATLPGMLERGRGDLVNFASVAGWIPTTGLGAYTATKFAVVAFTEILEHENRAGGVRFACVCPPVVDTPMISRLTGGPNTLRYQRRIPPAAVIDAIERGLERGELFVFPGRGTKTAVRARRLFPKAVWRRVDKAERG
jgi:NAD(P)-dependent dehydrogenase (short-subunit alcohol dehydrogenase family)